MDTYVPEEPNDVKPDLEVKPAPASPKYAPAPDIPPETSTSMEVDVPPPAPEPQPPQPTSFGGADSNPQIEPPETAVPSRQPAEEPWNKTSQSKPTSSHGTWREKQEQIAPDFEKLRRDSPGKEELERTWSSNAVASGSQEQPAAQPEEMPPPLAIFHSDDLNNPPGTAGSVAEESEASSPSGAYRPLNVKDALSYLEMVKHKFAERPDVYNQFLDIMKDFKSQAIDTPGVIERVSTLFNGHPSLIQGFNTFLPQGYRIDCSVEGEDNLNTITVTTPSGTHTQTSEGLIPRSTRRPTSVTPIPTPGTATVEAYFGGQTSGGYQNVPGQVFNDQVPAPGPPSALPSFPHPPGHHGIHSPHPSTPGVANLLGGLHQPLHHGGAVPAQDSKRPVEFNHAINYVNKIKNRFSSEPDTYKQFLEILQTYQRDQRPIQSVYQQVAILFDGSVDLLEEFKQFLPDTSQTGVGSNQDVGGTTGLFGIVGHMTSSTPPAGPSTLPPPKPDRVKDRRMAPQGPASDRGPNGSDKAAAAAAKRKKRPAEKESLPPPIPPARSHPPVQNGVPGPSKAKKAKHYGGKPEPQSPSFHGSPVPPLPQTDESMFFERVKKFIDDRATYQEFLKLLHLFTEEIIDIRTLIERANTFLGGPGSELMQTFKEVLGWDERTIVDGELGVSSHVRGQVSVVPTIDRPKVDLNTCRKYGPSYRKLPKHEALLACSGRDDMCWEVLNDEWVSHPTWASEDAGFNTHKKNLYEDAMHKAEEERHEYDFHIEAISRTIALLEPLNTRIPHLDAEERATWKLKPGLGGQGKSIYQRIIKKVYGREHGVDVIQALYESPAIAIPVILSRLKQKEEEWKRAQREWNKVWREVDARNFYKSLDHQGINFKVNDKKSINAKQLIQDIETKKREMDLERAKSIDPAFAKTIPKHQFAFEIGDVAVVQDCLKLIFSFLDRASAGSSMAQDAKQIETFMRTFLPLFFGFDEEEFNAPFLALNPQGGGNGTGLGTQNGTLEDPESDGDDSMAMEEEAPQSANNGKKKKTGDLRRKVLRGAASSGKKAGSSIAGKKSASSSRRESPAPAPADSAQMELDADDSVRTKGTSSRVQDNVWIRHGDNVEASPNSASARKPALGPNSRKGTFFANNTFYVLLRNLQLLYHRLYSAKKLAAELAAPPPSPSSRPDGAGLSLTGAGQVEPRPVLHAYRANPLAVSLGLADATGPGASRLVTSEPNPALHFYEHTLECCEQLFDGELDQPTFEDHLRFMYGIRAYHMFTIDKVVGSVIKQVQAVLSDVKNKELLTLLRRERMSSSPFSVQEQIIARRTAEYMIGPDENMYRVAWLPQQKIMQIQLLGKDDSTMDDAETITDRWKQYVASFVLRHQTEGLAGPVAPPLLTRSLLQIKPDPTDEAFVDEPSENAKPTRRRTPDTTSLKFRYGSKSGVEIKVCVRTYRLFFEVGGEDWFYRKRTTEEENVLVAKNDERESVRVGRMQEWIKQSLEMGASVSKPTKPNGSTALPAPVGAHLLTENRGTAEPTTRASTAGPSASDIEMKESA